MEGIDTSAKEIRELVRVKRDLLDMDTAAFVQFVRDDQRLFGVLGLYRAYQLADEWARARQRPREFEMRALHSLVVPSLTSAGNYKTAHNQIGGSAHKPTPPWNVSQEMAELAAWFSHGTGDAVLDAAVVHAWLSHIHPFDDGNGRMSRLLANLALIQSEFPPLLLRSQADRGPYFDALAASDEGDILPLYALFVKALTRTALTMEKPNYVQSKVRDELLKSVEQRHNAWVRLLNALSLSIQQKVKRMPWGAVEMGYPSIEDYALLEERSKAGNCWFMKMRERGEDRWLLWIGFRTDIAKDLIGGRRCWPSIFIGEKTEHTRAEHPYTTDWRRADVPTEIMIQPGVSCPVTIRDGWTTREMAIDEAAVEVVRRLCR